MTLPTPPPNAPAPVQPVAPVPVQVIGYASAGMPGAVPTGVKVLLGFLAAFHLMLGIPLILWPIAHIVIELANAYFNPGSLIGLAVGVATGAPNVACGVGLIWKRRRGTWRAIHAALAVLCGLELLAFVGGAALAIGYKDSTGWDQLALVFGVIIVIGASLLFWLHALTKLALLRANVRRAFFFEQDDPVWLQRGGTVVMMSLYGVLLVVGVVVFVVR